MIEQQDILNLELKRQKILDSKLKKLHSKEYQ